MSGITVYSKTGCPYCEKTKKWLEVNQVDATIVTLDHLPDRQALYTRLSAETGKQISTVPQIMIGNHHIGGYNDLIAQESDILVQLRVSVSDDF